MSKLQGKKFPTADESYLPTDVADSKKARKIRNILSYLMILGLLLSALFMARLLLWASESTDVLEVKNSPFPVRTIRDHPTADGVVILKVDFCKRTESIGRVRTSFVSPSREIFLPIAEDRGPKQCTISEIPVLIPHEIPKGTYKVKFRVEYKVNPLKTTFEEFESKEFEVEETQR